MIDIQEPMSPGWWLNKLMRRLGDRQSKLQALDDYYRGDPPLPEGARGCSAAYRDFQRKARTNYAALIVEAVRERMSPTGFRTGASTDPQGDDAAWAIWQANRLDADSGLVHRASLTMGDAYVIVGGVDEETGQPVITPEDPRQVYAVQDPIYRRRSIAAVKTYCDDVVGVDVAYLYLPGLVYRATRPRASSENVQTFDASSWTFDDEGTPQVLPANVVPVVRFPNRADLAGSSMGEFEDVTDTLDRINFMILQRLVIAAVQAFKQRAIKGELPAADADGNEIDYNGIFRADPGALWQLPPGVDIWESGQVDLNGILQAVRHDIQDVAAMTRTPLFYLTPDAANGSAEGATLAREGLVFKTSDRIVQAGESWEQVMSLAFLFAGDKERANRADMEVIWADPQRFSLAERYDAAVKAQAAGVPWETTMSSVLQYTPQEITRMRDERGADVLLAPQAAQVAALTAPVPTGAI